MADTLAEKLAEAKAKMFGDLHPTGGKTVIILKGDGNVRSPDPKVEVQKQC